MFKVKISNFIKDNIYKIKDFGTKLMIVAIIILIATIILSSNHENDKNMNIHKEPEVYTPKETIIKGEDISEKQYEEDITIVNKFVEYCNNSEIEKAYELLSDECKQNHYTSLDVFKDNYYSIIFKEKKEYNLQSWISTLQYTVYKIRYTTDMLSMGVYEQNNVYEDYITLIKNSEEEKLSIGNYITTEVLNKQTTGDKIEATVVKKDIYLEYEEYEMIVKNKTDKTILLDDLTNFQSIKLIGDLGGGYNAYMNKIFKTNLIIQSKTSKKIYIRFKKEAGSNNKSKQIRFPEVIMDYDKYINDENYKERLKIEIDL